MLRQERVEDREEALRTSLLGWQSEIWTMLPGIVESVDFEKNTCVIQPAIKGNFRQKDGSQKQVTMPLCEDVPLLFLGTAEFALTFPVKKGDEGCIYFASRCIDAWWQNGEVQPQAEFRFHDLSDGFFIPGFRSVPNAYAEISEDAVQLRNKDGDVFVEMKEDQVLVSVKDDTTILVKEDDITLTKGGASIKIEDGKITLTADELNFNGIVWGTHKHTGVQAGGANTGGPTA